MFITLTLEYWYLDHCVRSLGLVGMLLWNVVGVGGVWIGVGLRVCCVGMSYCNAYCKNFDMRWLPPRVCAETDPQMHLENGRRLFLSRPVQDLDRWFVVAIDYAY